MLFQNDAPHPAHRVFGDAVDCRYVHFETGDGPEETTAYTGRLRDRLWTGLSLSPADTLIAEGTAPLQTGIVASLRSGATLVYLCADQTFRTLHRRRSEPIWNFLPGVVDGVVAVSDHAWSWAEPYLDAPVEIVRPPIMPEKYEQLVALDPDSPADGPLVTIGDVRGTKNFEMLPALAERTGREVVVLGTGHDEEPYADHAAVRTPGWLSIEDFAATLERAALYVQPSEADACPVATMEAMLSGTPVLVSEGVGTKELGARAAPLDRFGAAAVESLDRPREERRAEGEENRKQVEPYTANNQGDRFREAMERWL